MLLGLSLAQALFWSWECTQKGQTHSKIPPPPKPSAPYRPGELDELLVLGTLCSLLSQTALQVLSTSAEMLSPSQTHLPANLPHTCLERAAGLAEHHMQRPESNKEEIWPTPAP